MIENGKSGLGETVFAGTTQVQRQAEGTINVQTQGGVNPNRLQVRQGAQEVLTR